MEQKNKSKGAQFIENCRNPFFFIEAMWGLTPQPCYEEYKGVLVNAEPEEWKAEWFGEKQEDWEWKWGEFIKGKHITWQQSAIIEGIRRAVFNRGVDTNKIAVKTGNGIGKSCLGAWIVLWFLFVFRESEVACTAPTAMQISDVLWKEIGMWLSKMPDVYKNLYRQTADYVYITEHPKWFARARTGKKENPEAMSGVHSPTGVLGLVDEASGVDDIVFEYSDGIKTAPFWMFLMFSNPTRPDGYFYRAFDTEEGLKMGKAKSSWRQYTFDSRQSPVVNREFVEEKLLNSGYGSDDFRIFVEGKFPISDTIDNSGYVPLLTREELEQAMTDEQNQPIVIQGIDPSGEGNDKTAFVGRNAYVAKILGEEDISSPKSIAARAATIISLYNIEPKKTIIDNFGSGANVGQELALSGFDVYPLNVGERASEEKFMNTRAELTWKMREWIKRGGMLVRDKRWYELLNIRYRYNESGKLQIMSKTQMRKNGIKSPNFADAFMLTFAALDIPRRKKQIRGRIRRDIYE